MAPNGNPVTFDAIVGTREFFNWELAPQGRKKLLGVLENMDFE